MSSTALLSSVLRWTVPALSNSAPVNILVGVTLYYCLYLISMNLYYRTVNSYHYYQLPGIPYRRYLAYIVGNAEIYLFDMNYLKRTRILRQMFEICMYIPEFLDVGVCRFSVAFQKFIILFKPDVVEDLFNSMQNIEKARQYEFFSDWLGLGLLTSTGDKWKRHRKLLTPAFHFKILESFVPVMNESSNEMLALFERQIDAQKTVSLAKNQSQLDSDDLVNNNTFESSSSDSTAQLTGPEGAEVDIRTYIGNCTLDTICETAMGINIQAQSVQCDQSAYIGPVNRVLINIIYRGMEPLLHNDIIFALSNKGRSNSSDLKIINKFVMNVIEERMIRLKAHLAENNISIDQIGAGDEIESFSRKERYAFLDLLCVTHLKFPEQFSLKDILDEVQTFMFEGHDTTSSGLTFALLLIASDRRVQEKIYEELESIFLPDGNETSSDSGVDKSSESSLNVPSEISHNNAETSSESGIQQIDDSLKFSSNSDENNNKILDDDSDGKNSAISHSDQTRTASSRSPSPSASQEKSPKNRGFEREISMEDCRQMKYLDMVIKECLRLYPPVPFIARKITKQFTVKGRILPEGCTCMVPIYLLHRDPVTFPNPEHFIPERFESDALNRSNPYAYVPFSAGARNCIGQKFAMMEMKIVLASIMRRYKLTSMVHRDEVDTVMSVVTKADSPITIRFDRR